MARQPGLGDHPQPATKIPQRARGEGHRRGRGEGEDLPENSQREPPDTRKKVSMSLSGTQMGPARPPRPTAPQPQQKPRSRCRRVFLAPAPPPPSARLRSAPPPRAAAVSWREGEGATGPLCTGAPFQPPSSPAAVQVRALRKLTAAWEPPRPRAGEGPGCRADRPSPPRLTSRPGVLGKPAGEGSTGDKRRSATPRAPHQRATLTPTQRDAGFYGWAGSGGREVAVTCSRRHTFRWAGCG